MVIMKMLLMINIIIFRERERENYIEYEAESKKITASITSFILYVKPIPETVQEIAEIN